MSYRVGYPLILARRHLDAAIRRRGRRPAIIGLWAVMSLGMAAESQLRWFFPPIAGIVFPHEQVPVWLLLPLWAAAGFFAMRGAFTRDDRDVANGFFALAFMPGAYAGSYLWAGVTTPDWRPAFFAITVWAPLSLIVYTAATDERPKPGDPDYDSTPVS